jgi:hypothetical protein
MDADFTGCKSEYLDRKLGIEKWLLVILRERSPRRGDPTFPRLGGSSPYLALCRTIKASVKYPG